METLRTKYLQMSYKEYKEYEKKLPRYSKEDFLILSDLLEDDVMIRGDLINLQSLKSELRRSNDMSHCINQIIQKLSIPGSHRDLFKNILFYVPLEDLPLYINVPSDSIQLTIKWRFQIAT